MNTVSPPTTQALVDKAKAVFVPNYAPRPLVLDRGRGSRVWDVEDREFIDFGTGISVSSLGHADPDLVAALRAQSEKLWHTSNVYYNEPAVRLGAALAESCCGERVFFCNSGAEANEAAIKLARKFSSLHYPEAKRDIITFQGSFHGRTLATVTATAQPKYHQGFEPLPGGFRYCPFNDFEAIEGLVSSDTTCAVLVEPIQGEGGIVPAAPGFMAHLRALCDRHNALLISDEIQCGMGRTGHFWAHAWAGVEPDLVTTAKALGNGIPIGALLAKARVADALGVGSHGTTFGGNPLACAVALAAVTKLRSEELLANVRRQGEAIGAALTALNQRLGIFAAIRGQGLMIGAPLMEAHQGRAGDIINAGIDHGILVLQAGPNVMRLLPPLTLNDTDREEGLERLTKALQACFGA
ncbi:MAG: aspartate aminotransferase family protein [Candidatus Competibacterales bacterium]